MRPGPKRLTSHESPRSGCRGGAARIQCRSLKSRNRPSNPGKTHPTQRTAGFQFPSVGSTDRPNIKTDNRSAESEETRSQALETRPLPSIQHGTSRTDHRFKRQSKSGGREAAAAHNQKAQRAQVKRAASSGIRRRPKGVSCPWASERYLWRYPRGDT